MRTQFSDHYKDAKRKIIRRLQPSEIYLGKEKSYEASLFFLQISLLSEAFAQIAILHFACLHFPPSFRLLPISFRFIDLDVWPQDNVLDVWP